MASTMTTSLLKMEASPMSDQLALKTEPDIKDELFDIPLTHRKTYSKPATPVPKAAKKEKSPSTPTPSRPLTTTPGPQRIGNLPRAEEQAFQTFVNIEENIYQFKTLGLSKAIEEGYQCDCVYEHGVSDPSDACGEGSECINRLTQVECDEDECRCRNYCQNRRFQRRETANVQVVLTEKKGFGLRAGEDIPKDAFIWEYIGEVVSHPSFMKRMREYGEEGLRHFYFMMLQKDEYIDATKKGGIGRFVNHSCNPNAYVAKWQVGKKMRMGIFAKRKILKDEELTFNYNVDRYGHDPQPCYCGEPNCVGYLGGKTQTDLSTMDDLYLDALGITDEVEALQLKGSKKKKAKKLDEDFIPEMKPLLSKEVPKVIQAMKQTTSRKVMLKLLTRIKITEDPVVLRSIMRLRAFSVMRALFQEFLGDIEMLSMGMECMLAFPLQNRNKVDDSKVEEEVQPLLEHDNEGLKTLAQRLIDHWATFSSAYRIPKRLEGETPNFPYIETVEPAPSTEDTSFRRRIVLPDIEFAGPKPLGTRAGNKFQKADITPTPVTPVETPKSTRSQDASHIAAIIAAAKKSAEDAQLAKEQAEAKIVEEEQAKKRKREEREKEKSRKKEKLKNKDVHDAEKQANKEKRLQKLVGAVVVKTMSKYTKDLGHDGFKKHAKEITTCICEKEKKSSSYAANKLESLSEEKQSKIKKFTKTYVYKLISKMRKSKTSSNSSAANGRTASLASPGENGADHHVTSAEMDDMMDDISMDGDGDGDGDGVEDAQMEDADGIAMEDGSPNGETCDSPSMTDSRQRLVSHDLSPINTFPSD